MQYPLAKTSTSCTIVASVKYIDRLAFCGLLQGYSGEVYLTSITFEITNNWYKTDSSDFTNGDAIDVSNPTTNATNLTAMPDYMNPNWSMKYLYRVDE